jgi:hypothetical protein
MKTKKALFYLLAGILAGCVPSLHSLFTEKDTFFDPQLVGAWSSSSESSKETWQFTKKPDSNSYEVIFTDNDGNKGSFVGALGKIDGMTFLDLFPDNTLMEIRSNEFYQAHLVPAHTFMKIEQIQPVLKMRAMDPDKTREMLKNDPNLLKYELIDDNRVVITAPTQQLQKFMKEHANDKGLFDGLTELKRLEPAEPNVPDANNAPKDVNKTAVKPKVPIQ